MKCDLFLNQYNNRMSFDSSMSPYTNFQCFVCVKSRKSNACSLQFTAPTNRFESVPHTCYWTREKSENRTKKKKERRRRNVDKRRASLRWNESRWLAAQRRRRDGRNDRNGVEYEANEWTASRTPASPSPICQWRPKRRDAPAESKEKDNEMIEWDFFFLSNPRFNHAESLRFCVPNHFRTLFSQPHSPRWWNFVARLEPVDLREIAFAYISRFSRYVTDFLYKIYRTVFSSIFM